MSVTDCSREASAAVPRPKSRRIKSAQGLVEGDDIPDLRMIGKQRDHIAVAAEHILGKSLQRFFRSNFNKHASAGIVQRAQALNKLHRRSNLLRENVQHLRHDVRPRGIKLAVSVGDDWQTWRLEMQPFAELRRSGLLAPATIEVWKAWLTGIAATS